MSESGTWSLESVVSTGETSDVRVWYMVESVVSTGERSDVRVWYTMWSL